MGLEKIVKERVCPKQKIGFDAGTFEQLTNAELMQRVTHGDLAKFGMMPELLGRIGTILTIPPLKIDDYRQLLNAESGSLRRKYHNYLSKLYGVTFEIADTGVEEIAQRCMKSETGARAVNPIVNDMMRSAVAAVESDPTICKVILDAEGDGCCIRYERGARAYSFYDFSQSDDYPWEIVKDATVASLADRLYQYYRLSDASITALPQVKAFLNCAITFLFINCRPSERTFESLEKLARATHRFNSKSPFDIIMDDALEAKTMTRQQIQKFNNAYTPQMQQNLVEALQIIMTAIRAKLGPCQVRFDVLELPEQTA